MEAGVQRGDRHRGVQMVRRHDRERVDALVCGQCAFVRDHFIERRIDALRVQAEQRAGARVAPGVGAERARDELPVAVERGGHPVDSADKGPLPAADHAETKAAHARTPDSPSSLRIAVRSMPLAAKSSNGRSVRRIMWSRMNGAPSRAPSSDRFSAHSHSSTAQPS